MKKNVYLMQVNYSVYFRGTVQYWLPYSVGCLAATAQAHEAITDNFNQILLHRREDPDTVVDSLDNPVCMAFSMYVWNSNYQLVVAKKVRERYPECVIVFGGPSAVPEHVEQGLCDVYVDGEGELQYVDVLYEILNNNLQPGEREMKRIDGLSTLPSPYLSGVFDDLIARYPECTWQATIETDRGCPYQCTFCDWGSLTHTKIRKYDMTKVQAEIDWIIANPIVYVFVANGNFGVFPDRDIPIARMLRAASDHPDSILESVNVQYLKNNTETALIVERTLNGLGKGITLSRQSNNGMVLDAIKRKNLSTEKFANLIELSNYYNVPNYTEFILPLPLETLDTFKQGICTTLAEGQHNSIDVWPASVLPKAEMGSPEYKEKYGLVTVPVSNYSQYSGQTDDVHVDYTDGDTTEITDVVIETNTMTRSEVLEAWCFIWVVSRFHFCGYSQIISRYLHGNHGISYYDYYTEVFARVQSDPWMSKVYQQIAYIIEHQLIHGSFPDPDTLTVKGLVPEVNSYHFVNQLARGFVYDNRERFSQLATEVAHDFIEYLPRDIFDLQDNFIYNPEKTYPQTHEAHFDIFTNTVRPTTYFMHDKADYTKRLAERAGDKDLGVFTQRRQGYRCYLTTPERNSQIDRMQESADQKVDDILDRIERGEKITRNVIASS